MVFERHPSMPPPPGRKHSGTTPSVPTPSKPERREAINLTPVEKALFKNAAEYGNLTPETAQMTPKLREILENFRKSRLFVVEVYVLSGGGDGHYGNATYDTSAIRNPGTIYADIDPLNRVPIKYKRKHQVAESLAFTPIQTRDKKIVEKVTRPAGIFRKEVKEQVTEYTSPRPMRFQEAVPTAPTSVAQEELVRLTYHASDPHDPLRYQCDTHMDVSWRKGKDILHSGKGYFPEPASSDPAENINIHMKDILHTPSVKPEGPRPDNQMAVGLMLPLSRAKELWNYFQQHPEHVRPFFIAGVEDIMPLHLPPPYKAWDAELSAKPILFREFDNSKKEVNQAIIPVSKSGK